VAEIYVSHVLEHLGYQSELARTLDEFHRVLKPGGVLRASVRDLSTLCALFVDPGLQSAERFHVMRMMFGGQLDRFDFHKVGLSEEFLAGYLTSAGFTQVERVDAFGLFEDSSSIVFKGRPISLNIAARKRDR
jgi:predicted SAM-dependent methyltransferase